jgi:flagellar assembly protein FliH
LEGPQSSLQIVADERLDTGECVLDTNVGRVELGVSAQLEEIERGFFDLMQQRPA